MAVIDLEEFLEDIVTVLEFETTDDNVYKFGRLIISSHHQTDVGLTGSLAQHRKKDEPCDLRGDAAENSLMASLGLPTTFTGSKPRPQLRGKRGSKGGRGKVRNGGGDAGTDSSAWNQCWDDSTGYYYYYNTSTDESTWEAPAEGYIPYRSGAAAAAAAAQPASDSQLAAAAVSKVADEAPTWQQSELMTKPGPGNGQRDVTGGHGTSSKARSHGQQPYYNSYDHGGQAPGDAGAQRGRQPRADKSSWFDEDYSRLNTAASSQTKDQAMTWQQVEQGRQTEMPGSTGRTFDSTVRNNHRQQQQQQQSSAYSAAPAAPEPRAQPLNWQQQQLLTVDDSSNGGRPGAPGRRANAGEGDQWEAPLQHSRHGGGAQQQARGYQAAQPPQPRHDYNQSGAAQARGFYDPAPSRQDGQPGYGASSNRAPKAAQQPKQAPASLQDLEAAMFERAAAAAAAERPSAAQPAANPLAALLHKASVQHQQQQSAAGHNYGLQPPPPPPQVQQPYPVPPGPQYPHAAPTSHFPAPYPHQPPYMHGAPLGVPGGHPNPMAYHPGMPSSQHPFLPRPGTQLPGSGGLGQLPAGPVAEAYESDGTSSDATSGSSDEESSVSDPDIAVTSASPSSTDSDQSASSESAGDFVALPTDFVLHYNDDDVAPVFLHHQSDDEEAPAANAAAQPSESPPPESSSTSAEASSSDDGGASEVGDGQFWDLGGQIAKLDVEDEAAAPATEAMDALIGESAAVCGVGLFSINAVLVFFYCLL